MDDVVAPKEILCVTMPFRLLFVISVYYSVCIYNGILGFLHRFGDLGDSQITVNLFEGGSRYSPMGCAGSNGIKRLAWRKRMRGWHVAAQQGQKRQLSG
jgi:hypothetical protein